MHFPLRGGAIVRTRELRALCKPLLIKSKREFVSHERVLRRLVVLKNFNYPFI